jgi:hypothetical protein
MTGLCFFLRRRFVPYLEGRLSPGEREHLETHIARCRRCRELMSQVRAGHEAGRQFGRLGPEDRKRPPEFDELWAGTRAETLLRPMSWSRAVPALVVLVIALAAVLVMSRRAAPWRSGGQAVLSAAAGRSRGFVPLRIGEFPSKSAAPVVTEGFVRGVYFDKEEKTLHIKLVEQEQEGEPFVICEVRSPGRMAIPQEGSRVRVYGTPRFDPQPGRGWSEVNPVTNIDILKR